MRLSKATSDTSAQSASFALTTVSRKEYPRPTCNSNVRNNASDEENPRKRLTAPDSSAARCHPVGSSDRSTFQFFCEVSMRQACIRNRKNSRRNSFGVGARQPAFVWNRLAPNRSSNSPEAEFWRVENLTLRLKTFSKRITSSQPVVRDELTVSQELEVWALEVVPRGGIYECASGLLCR
jgi:hypothetical protein